MRYINLRFTYLLTYLLTLETHYQADRASGATNISKFVINANTITGIDMQAVGYVCLMFIVITQRCNLIA